MSLPVEVVQRLIVVKGILGQIRHLPTGQPDRISLARNILNAHDAAELAIAAVAGYLDLLSSKPMYLMDYLSIIRDSQRFEKPKGHAFFSQLNSVRVSLKHKGIFPDPRDWQTVGEKTWDYVSQWCQDYLNIAFNDLDESELIKDPSVKRSYAEAVEAFHSNQYEKSLQYIALAAHLLFEGNRALRRLAVGYSSAEDAIKLAAFGVHANNYLALQEFLPRVSETNKTYSFEWKQAQYGHPANWTESSTKFCLDTFVEVAVRIQDADWVPGPVPFAAVFEYKVTALDDVNVVGELQGGVLNQTRPIIRKLLRNESVRCKLVGSQNFFARQVLGEEPDKLIRLFSNDFVGYVDRGKVHITCVPLDAPIINKYFPHLEEIEYLPE